MANMLFDMNINQPWIFPYIGAGAGYAWTNLDNVHPSGSSFPKVNGTAGNFAYQAMLGASFPIAAVQGLSLTAEYRFMGVVGDTHYNVGGAPIRVAMKDQYNHGAMFGLRYAFGAPAAAPAPIPAAAPVMAPTRSFMVFFDWDKYNLTERARAVVRDAAQASRSVQHTQIEVNGYADTSGSPGYNMPLSMKRAQAVAAELVSNGVARQEIAIKAFGDTVLLVPTGPGVREPQNRRVEIIIK
jgi:outer membrane protein OmpA-like peptidoglycan-associated protein